MPKPGYRVFFLSIGLLAWLLTGCHSTPTTPEDAASLRHTQAVQTVSAQLTLDAGSTAVAMLTRVAQSTPPVPSATATLPPPTGTPAPLPASPTHTPLPPTPTQPSLPCDWLRFVSDVRVPDGREYLPGVNFIKTWRLENIGSCTWTRQYALVFSNGDRMSGETAILLDRDVPPGDSVDLSVSLTAPAAPGTYTGYWQLRNASGVLFGAGATADLPFFVRIQVDLEDQILYDLAANYCKAGWSNSRGALECPTPLLDETSGFVYSDRTPRLENGMLEDELALITHPDEGGRMRIDLFGEQGLVVGVFPRRSIEEGDRFEAIIGCLFGSEDCNVLFYLMIEKPDGSYAIEASWQEYYDGNITPVRVDLSAWSGKEVRLMLVVVANGSAQEDYAFWLHPRLMR